MFPVARALHSPAGATIGEIFTFLSGLYFRGKLAYAEAFARPPQRLNSGVFVITPNRGLLGPCVRMTLDELAGLAKTDIDASAEEFRKPPCTMPRCSRRRSARGESLFYWAASPHPNT